MSNGVQLQKMQMQIRMSWRSRMRYTIILELDK